MRTAQRWYRARSSKLLRSVIRQLHFQSCKSSREVIDLDQSGIATVALDSGWIIRDRPCGRSPDAQTGTLHGQAQRYAAFWNGLCWLWCSAFWEVGCNTTSVHCSVQPDVHDAGCCGMRVDRTCHIPAIVSIISRRSGNRGKSRHCSTSCDCVTAMRPASSMCHQ